MLCGGKVNVDDLLLLFCMQRNRGIGLFMQISAAFTFSQNHNILMSNASADHVAKNKYAWES